MANQTTTEKLAGLVLSATEVQELTSWTDPMVEDYLNILRNLVSIAQDVDIIDDREIIFDAKASQLLAVLQGEIRHNQGRLTANRTLIGKLEQIIAIIDVETKKHRSKIAMNEKQIKKATQIAYAW